MATVQSPPILIYEPGGGVSVGPVSNPPVYSQAGTTPLVEDQAYIDVVFGSVQTTDEWVLVECIVVNELDVDPLNIWPGIITDKAAAGFRIQLNGMPDSGNYYLHWAVSGINITPSPASTYYLSGPATGGIHVDSTAFTVSLPPSTTVPGAVTVTPDDGGIGGTFTPASVMLTSSSRTATFTYTPTIYGAAAIGVTNSGGLIDPASIAFTCVATGYGFTGPTSGDTGVASTDFTVELPSGSVVIGTVTVIPSDGAGGGAFTPATVNLTTAAPSATFTYTPANAGAQTISVTNNGGLINPANLTYTVVIPLPTYALSGPTSGTTGIAEVYTVTLAGSPTISGTVTITPNDSSGGGTFTPSTVGITDASPAATFTYTAASSATRTINVTNDRGLTDPTGISYTSAAPIDPSTITGLKLWLKADALALSDGTSFGIATPWTDSSGNGYDLTTANVAYPIFKTNIVNAKPVVRFNGADQNLSRSTDISVSQPDTIFMVAKQKSKTAIMYLMWSSGNQVLAMGATGYYGIYAGTTNIGGTAPDYSGAFHVFTAIFSGGNGTGYVDGTLQIPTASTGSSPITNVNLGCYGGGASNFADIDIAEVLIYNSALSNTDRANVENYLRAKYALP